MTIRDRTIDNAFIASSHHGTRDEPFYSGALSFLRRRYSRDLAGVDVAVTGLPVDIATSNRPGTRFGPRAIREASALLSCDRLYGSDVEPLERLTVVDYGDCVWDYGRPELIPGAIQRHIAGILAAGASPLSLGGDHFVSLPVLRALREQHGTLSLIHFDAHTDTWENGGARRLDHGSMFRDAVKEGVVDPSRSVQIGIRTHNPDTMGFHILDAPWVHRRGADAVIERIREVIGDREAYLSFDIDCLDPAFAPGTGTPVIGGLSSATALEILRGLRGTELVGADLVEVAPAYDPSGITALAGASLAYEFLALYAYRPGARAR